MRGRTDTRCGARRRKGERTSDTRRAATQRRGGQRLPIGDPGRSRCGGDRGRADCDGERIGVGRRGVIPRGGRLRGRDGGGADGDAGDHTGGGIDRGFAGIATGVGDRTVAAAGQG